jgi:hypothetical protein
MSEDEVRILEDKTSNMLHQLNLVLNPIPQAQPPTQVEEVEQALYLIEDLNKQIRFQLNTHNWKLIPRRGRRRKQNGYINKKTVMRKNTSSNSVSRTDKLGNGFNGI